MCVSEKECACVCVCFREKKREFVIVSEIGRLIECVCVREIEKIDRESVCVCLCICMCMGKGK